MPAPDQRSLGGSRIRRRLRPGCVESVGMLYGGEGEGKRIWGRVYSEDFPFFICTT